MNKHGAEMEKLLLTVPPGVAPRTETGEWGVVMRYASGQNEKKQWFDYRPSAYLPTVRAEWALGTMMAAVPSWVAVVLVEHGYARVMTLDEARTFNKLRDETMEVQLDVSA